MTSGRIGKTKYFNPCNNTNIDNAFKDILTSPINNAIIATIKRIKTSNFKLLFAKLIILTEIKK